MTQTYDPAIDDEHPEEVEVTADDYSPMAKAADMLVKHRRRIYEDSNRLQRNNQQLLAEVEQNSKYILTNAEEMNKIDQALRYIAPDKV